MSKRIYLEFINDPEPGDRLTFAQTEAIAEARRIGAKQIKNEQYGPSVIMAHGLYAQHMGRANRPVYTPVGRLSWPGDFAFPPKPRGITPTQYLESMERGARYDGGSASLTIKGVDNFMVKVGESGELMYSFNGTRRDRESFERVLTRCLMNAKN